MAVAHQGSQARASAPGNRSLKRASTGNRRPRNRRVISLGISNSSLPSATCQSEGCNRSGTIPRKSCEKVQGLGCYYLQPSRGDPQTSNYCCRFACAEGCCWWWKDASDLLV